MCFVYLINPDCCELHNCKHFCLSNGYVFFLSISVVATTAAAVDVCVAVVVTAVVRPFMLFTIQRDRWTRTCNLYRTLPLKNYVHTWAWIASERLKSKRNRHEERKRDRQRENKIEWQLATKNRYDFNKWAIWMKLKMFELSLVTAPMRMTMTGMEIKNKHCRVKIHGPVARLSNPHEMFLVSFKKRFCENREIVTYLKHGAHLHAIKCLSHTATSQDKDGGKEGLKL